MKKFLALMLVLVLSLFVFAGCGGGEGEVEPEATPGVEINLFAAASLTDCMNEIIALYQEESGNIVMANYAGSGTLREQIEAGADCDLFISANQKHMNTLEDAGAINAETRRDLLNNALVLVAATEKADAVTSVEDLATDAVASVAVGQPEEVPAGEYAIEAMTNMGIWEQVEPKVAYGKDVVAVTQYVDSGNADCGFVYRTDAMGMTTGVIVCDVPAEQYTPVNYPSAILANAPQADAAADFYEFLSGAAAKEIFEKYGFTVL